MLTLSKLSSVPYRIFKSPTHHKDEMKKELIDYNDGSAELEAFVAWQEAQEPKVQQQEADGQDADKDKRPADIPEDDDS